MIMFTSRQLTYLIIFVFLFLDSVLGIVCFGDFICCRFCKRPQSPVLLDDLRKELLCGGLVCLRVDEGSKTFLEPVCLFWRCPLTACHVRQRGKGFSSAETRLVDILDGKIDLTWRAVTVFFFFFFAEFV